MPTRLQLLDGEKAAKPTPARIEAIPGAKFAYTNGSYMVLDLSSKT